MRDSGTLNERLSSSGNFKKFDRALKRNDRKELLIILKSVGIENPDIDFLIKNAKTNKPWLFKIWDKIFC